MHDTVLVSGPKGMSRDTQGQREKEEVSSTKDASRLQELLKNNYSSLKRPHAIVPSMI